MDTNFLGIPAEGVGVSTNPLCSASQALSRGNSPTKGNTAITIETKRYFVNRIVSQSGRRFGYLLKQKTRSRHSLGNNENLLLR